MIIDTLDEFRNHQVYDGRIRKAVTFLMESNFERIAEGRHEIDGSDVYAVINKYTSKPSGECLWEVHRNFVDVHFAALGEEMIGFASEESLAVVERYDEKKDAAKLRGEGEFFSLAGKRFAIFFPGECHMPGVVRRNPAEVLKVVIKIKAKS